MGEKLLDAYVEVGLGDQALLDRGLKEVEQKAASSAGKMSSVFSRTLGRGILQGLGIGAGAELFSRLTRGVVGFTSAMFSAAAAGRDVGSTLQDWVAASLGIETATERMAKFQQQQIEVNELLKATKKELERLQGIEPRPGANITEALDRKKKELMDAQEALKQQYEFNRIIWGEGILGALGSGKDNLSIELAKLESQISAIDAQWKQADQVIAKLPAKSGDKSAAARPSGGGGGSQFTDLVGMSRMLQQEALKKNPPLDPLLRELIKQQAEGNVLNRKQIAILEQGREANAVWQ